jgi:tryptophan-rich sensory protein
LTVKLPKFHLEPFLFSVVWALLAIAGTVLGGMWAGAALALGLLLVLMPLSAIILTRYEDLALERQVRWGVLVIAGLGLAVWLNA